MKRVYRIFSASGDLLYVGKSGNVDNRLAAHRRWMPPNCRVDITDELDDVEATILERRAIICEAPRRNKVWNHRCMGVGEPTISAITAAVYLVGNEPRYEGYAELVVEGYGIAPVDPGMADSTGWRGRLREYRLADVEAMYRQLMNDRVAA